MAPFSRCLNKTTTTRRESGKLDRLNIHKFFVKAGIGCQHSKRFLVTESTKKSFNGNTFWLCLYIFSSDLSRLEKFPPQFGLPFCHASG